MKNNINELTIKINPKRMKADSGIVSEIDRPIISRVRKEAQIKRMKKVMRFWLREITDTYRTIGIASYRLCNILILLLLVNCFLVHRHKKKKYFPFSVHRMSYYRYRFSLDIHIVLFWSICFDCFISFGFNLAWNWVSYIPDAGGPCGCSMRNDCNRSQEASFPTSRDTVSSFVVLSIACEPVQASSIMVTMLQMCQIRIKQRIKNYCKIHFMRTQTNNVLLRKARKKSASSNFFLRVPFTEYTVIYGMCTTDYLFFFIHMSCDLHTSNIRVYRTLHAH